MLVMTSGVQIEMAQDIQFSQFVFESLKRFRAHDWGEMHDEDKVLNDEALETGDRIMGAYDNKTQKEIWIILDAGHALITILFPDEY